MARAYRKPARKRVPTNTSRLPTEPGLYYWSEWKAHVNVYRKRGGKYLYVVPPGGAEVRVTPFIAGTFKPAQESPKP